MFMVSLKILCEIQSQEKLGKILLWKYKNMVLHIYIHLC